MLCLYLQAPFGAFRNFTAGSFRPTADFITYSAAYGLLLNVAGIEMRYDDNQQPMTLIGTDLPRFRIAIAALSFPIHQSVLQLLHNYPVGTLNLKGEALEAKKNSVKGGKYNIAPVRRSFLSGINGYICVDAYDEIESRILNGLRGEVQRDYGLPFLGDNSFLIDRLQPVHKPNAAHWFVSVTPENPTGYRKDLVMRLTISINRADMSRTTSGLFAPVSQLCEAPPDSAWVEVGY